MRGKGLTYQGSNSSAELLLQQYLVAVSPRVNTRKSEQLQVCPPKLACHLDYYPNLCKELHVTVYNIQPHCFFFVGLFWCSLYDRVQLSVLGCCRSHARASPHVYRLFLNKVVEALALSLQHVPDVLSFTCPRALCRSGCISGGVCAFSFHGDGTCCTSLLLPTLPSSAQAVAMKGKRRTRAQREVTEEKEKEKRSGGKQWR